MDWHIKSELQEIMKLPEIELDITYVCFLDVIRKWWQHENFVLKDTNSKEKDPLRKLSEIVKPLQQQSYWIRGIPNLMNSVLNTKSPQ